MCEEKITSDNALEFELFVSSNSVDIQRDASLKTGDFLTPFIDLMDAITRAKEIAA